MKCKLSLLLTSFVLVCVLLVSAPLTANAAVGAGELWDAVVSIQHKNGNLYLTYSHDSHYSHDDDLTRPYQVVATFEGSTNLVVDIQMYEKDVFLNGYLRKRLTFTPTTVISDEADYGYLNVVGHPIVTDSYFVTMQPVDRNEGGETEVDIYVYFNNYYVNDLNLKLPLQFDLMMDAYIYTNNHSYFGNKISTKLEVTADWYGDMRQYDKLEDVPSVDGYLSQQNQTIIDQSQTQNNLTTEQNALIQNQTTQQHSDSRSEIYQGIANSQNEIKQGITNSQNEINQGIANTDKLANGYDESQMNNTTGILGDSVGDLEDAEDVVLNFGKDNLDAYTITTGGILAVSDKLNAGMSLVSSMLQSIYTSAESWNYVIALGFTLTISSMVTGLFRYFKE